MKYLQIFFIIGLLLTPEPLDPLDSASASEYQSNLDTYLQKAL